jgi:hypothetical protein
MTNNYEDKIIKLENNIYNLKEKMRIESQNAFLEIIKEYFEKYPLIEKISWKQYTDYFCDGDPCEFGCRAADGYFFLNDIDIDASDLKYAVKRDSELIKFIEPASELHKILKEISQENFLIMFGDHAEVIITKYGIEIEEYKNHD